MSRLVSIIIPIYNVQDYLVRCLNSVILQTYSNLEIILIDDGSTDGSPGICEEFASLDSRVVFYCLGHYGVSYARNYGLKKASGEWVTFVDADDWIAPEYIAAMSQWMFDEIDLICGFQEKDDVLDGAGQQEDIAQAIAGHGYAWGKLIRKERIKSMFDTRVQYAEDFIFYTALMGNLRKVALTSCQGYHYCIRPGSLSVKHPGEAYTVQKIEAKYTFIKGYSSLEEASNSLDREAKTIIWAHTVYVYTTLLFLGIRFHYTDRTAICLLKKLIRHHLKDAYKETLCKKRNIKRFGFEVIVLFFPKIGTIAAKTLLETTKYG